MKAVFIGDELTATGFRLTGIATLTPTDGAEAAREAVGRSELVIVTAEHAGMLPPKDASLGEPLVAVVPDIRGRAMPPDLGRKLRRILGIES